MTTLSSILSGTCRAIRRACGLAAGLLDAVPAGLGLRARGAQTQALVARFFMLVVMALPCALAAAATPPNTAITNTASASYDVGAVTLSATGAVTLTTAGSTPAAIQFMTYAASGSAGAASRVVPPTACLGAGGSSTTLAAPTVPGVGVLPNPGSYPLVAATAYGSSDIAFIQVTDYSANVDPTQAEPLLVTVSNASGDVEKLRLLETGPSTGVFAGYLPLVHGAVQPGDCRLEVQANEKIVATYVQSGSSTVSTSFALVDPLGLVFDSATGQPVDGARVTLIDVATGQPAQVRGDDGVSSYPSTVVSGGTATDAGGTSYAFGPGRYQFPRVVAPGTYRLQIGAPAGYRFPSTVADAPLQQLPGAPFQLNAISRGGPFTALPGPPVEADVPLDPAPYGSVDLVKSAGKTVVAIGDFLPYTVTASNSADQGLPGLQLVDRLPAGFRYAAGSVRLNGVAINDPQVSADGRSLLFSLGLLASRSSATLSYVVAVGPSAVAGPAQNTVQAVGRITSNVAGASVTVQEDLNRSRAILMGQVTVAPSCEADAGDPQSRRPIAGVRLLLQDGTYVVTDSDGNWHIDNVRPGTHVVQVDTATLPPGLQLHACEDNSRTGGRDHSQFVNVRGGTLWRADFRYAPVPTCLRQEMHRAGRRVDVLLSAPTAQQSLTATVVLPTGAHVEPGSVLVDGKPAAGLQVEDGFVVIRTQDLPARWQRQLTLRLADDPGGDLRLSVRVRPQGASDVGLPSLSLAKEAREATACGALPAPDLDVLRARPVASKPKAAAAGTDVSSMTTDAQGQTFVEQLPYDDQWLAAAKPGVEWLHPKADFSPALPSIKVAVKHAASDSVELRVNGQLVDPLRFDGVKLNPAGTLALSLWRGVEIHSGSNVLQVTVRAANGEVVSQERREIHFGTTIARLELDPARSRLVADGRTPPMLAIRFLDPEGKPVRRGLTGDFSVEPPYAPLQAAQAIQREPLTGLPGGRAKFEIGENGVALVPLQPTSHSGEAVLRFDIGTSTAPAVRAWLQADQREWVLVGFAEGTTGHKTLAGNMEALKDAGAADQLFDQNRLAFYARGMVKGEYLLTAAYDSAKERGTGFNPQLGQAIDPNRFYTLYGDASQQQYDAASVRKLYLKIEKQQFYALFGDFNTGLTVTELGRYSRTVNGVKSEYKGDTFSYNAFATRTSQAFLKDEIQGDGTSGLYRLRTRNIVANSDKVRVEVRDRFQPERVLSTRPMTPWLDYQLDTALGTLLLRQPLASRDADFNPQFLVIEYESDGGSVEGWTYGGRAAAQVGPNAAVGVTRVHEGDPGREGTLTAADASVRLGEKTRAKVEVATSTRQDDGASASGKAYLAEVQHDDGRAQWRAYAREQQEGFGLGQQSALARGQRRVGVEGRDKLDDRLQVQGEVSRAEDLATGASRDVAEARAQWQANDALKLQAGLRLIEEKDGQGGATGARQVTAGVSYDTMEQRLLLRASTELDMSGGASGGTASYPNRVLLGAEYRLTPEVALTAQQEFAQANGVRLSTSSVGLRAQPWSGAELRSNVGTQGTGDADRLFASMGLLQRWRIDEHWSVDASLDQSHTLKGALPADALNQVPTSGTLSASSPVASVPSGSASSTGLGLVANDYTALSAGAAYRDDAWSANGRVERRLSALDSKLNVLLGVQRKLDAGEAVAGALQWTAIQGGTSDGERVNARLSYVWQPDRSRWVVLNRLEYAQESSPSLASRLFVRKLINNTNANWKPEASTQVALQYSAKYVREMLQDFTASGYTDLVGLEARHDLTSKLDLGLHMGMLHTWATRQRSYQAGVSVGYRVATNTWVSVGYNVLGFWDADFTGAEYRAKGVYLNVRTKFDQDTFDLNDRPRSALPLK